QDLLEEGEAFSAQPRFTIMFLLYLHRKIGFTELAKVLNLTPGNLNYHIKQLKKAGLVQDRKIISWRPLVVIEITSEGTSAFRMYAIHLKAVLRSID
ncbi:MAG: transcriptional regulator, partial [Candidatus Hodarchaeales archaeon]